MLPLFLKALFFHDYDEWDKLGKKRGFVPAGYQNGVVKRYGQNVFALKVVLQHLTSFAKFGLGD